SGLLRVDRLLDVLLADPTAQARARDRGQVDAGLGRHLPHQRSHVSGGLSAADGVGGLRSGSRSGTLLLRLSLRSLGLLLLGLRLRLRLLGLRRRLLLLGSGSVLGGLLPAGCRAGGVPDHGQYGAYLGV